ncbi:MAG TPA: ATP synthase subunit I [Gallionella sp.]|nr:ATP synthase subunit I [Gallionella sp.]
MSWEEDDKQQRCLTPQENAAIIRALFDAEIKEKQLARTVVGLQLAVVFAVAGATYIIGKTPQYAIAVLSGGVVSVLNGALLAWRMSRAASVSAHDAHLQLRLMYFYAAERFLVVVALLALCMAVLKLSPLGVLGGFVLGQAALLSARLLLRLKN